MFEIAYSYTAKDSRRQKIEGVVLAANLDQAIYRLRTVELRDVKISLSPFATLRGWISSSFSAKELALFYRTLADRMETELPIVTAIESSAEFLSDPRLRQAVRMAALTARGAKLHEALSVAGFPHMDCKLLEAVRESGETVETLHSMAERLDRESKLKTEAIMTLLPTLMAIALIALFFWAFVIFLAPTYAKYYTDRNLFDQMTPWVRAVYSIASAAAAQKELFTAAYFGGIVAFIALTKSQAGVAVMRLIPGVDPLLTRWEHMRAWSAFRVMLKADIGLPRICRMLANAATMSEVRDSFERGARLVDNGADMASMVERVQFPDYVVRYIRSAAPGKLEDAIKRLVKSLDNDTKMLAERVKLTTSTIGFGLAAMTIYFAFRVTYMENFMLLRKLI